MKLHYILSRTLCSGLCGEWNILPVSFKRTFSALSSNAVLINQEVDKFDVANKSNVAPLQKDSIDWKWQSSKTVVQCKYKNGKGMLPVEVNVFDNHLGSDAPTVVMLLGLSGSGDDFKDMVTFLSSAGIRCVAPEIPGFGDSEISRSDIYRLDFTSAGQSQMLIDILKEIDVGRIDSVVAHSAASWLAVRLGASQRHVKSLSLINPMSVCPNKAMRPYAWTKLVGATARKEKLWPIADSYINIGARRSGFKIPQHKKRQMFVSLETVSTVDFDLVKQDAKTIQEKRLPAFVAWSQNDKMIEESLTRHLLSLLDVQENVSTKPQSRYTKEVVFNNGGHVLHRKQAKSLSENIISMLQQIL
ncbi:uncharacterized protein LOC125681504 isoform X1 [Ostrea edulis]|uniref:uncharacterized protein LOC125681504 isoform X1 n=1 Tax=Ostrea edulis TaxID=37623 RepID=UPI0024AFB693|nr:uncharacterized protein LOC125681504 isoform X1 [Ostrea edulis]